MSGHSIQNSMTNKNGRTKIKIRGILLCSYSYAKSVLMSLHIMCANPYSCYFARCRICVRFYV